MYALYLSVRLNEKGAKFILMFLIYSCYYIYNWYNGVYCPR